MEEVWRPVVGYEGLYEVSSEGRVRSLDRIVTFKNGKHRLFKGCMLVQDEHLPYNTVHLCCKTKYVHRLVGEAFPDICGEWFEECQTDHIDTDARNNKATNLRNCTEIENHNNPLTRKHNSEAKTGCVPWNRGRTYECHNISKALKGKGLYADNPNAKPILQYSLQGDFIKEWDCTKTAAETMGIKASGISLVLNGHRQSAYGYVWKFAS